MVRAEGPVDLGSHTLAYCLHGERDLYVMINAFWEPVAFRFRKAMAGCGGSTPAGMISLKSR